MISNFELKLLATITHNDTIAKAQRRKLARSLKKRTQAASKEYRGIVIRESKPCQC